jgi:hypothetical protein
MINYSSEYFSLYLDRRMCYIFFSSPVCCVTQCVPPVLRRCFSLILYYVSLIYRVHFVESLGATIEIKRMLE